MFNAEHFGKTISELRKAHNMSQSDLADIMDVSFQAVSNWERGNSMPDISRLPDLAQLFCISVDELLSEKPENCNTDEHHKTDGIPPEKTEHYEPVKIQRVSENIPSHLVKVQDGKQLFSLLDGCCAFEYDYDFNESREKAQLISSFLQEIQDYVDFCTELDISSQFETQAELEQSVSELSDADIWIFAARENRIVTGGMGIPENFPVLILRILNSNNESIIKMVC